MACVSRCDAQRRSGVSVCHATSRAAAPRRRMPAICAHFQYDAHKVAVAHAVRSHASRLCGFCAAPPGLSPPRPSPVPSRSRGRASVSPPPVAVCRLSHARRRSPVGSSLCAAPRSHTLRRARPIISPALGPAGRRAWVRHQRPGPSIVSSRVSLLSVDTKHSTTLPLRISVRPHRSTLC